MLCLRESPVGSRSKSTFSETWVAASASEQGSNPSPSPILSPSLTCFSGAGGGEGWPAEVPHPHRWLWSSVLPPSHPNPPAECFRGAGMGASVWGIRAGGLHTDYSRSDALAPRPPPLCRLCAQPTNNGSLKGHTVPEPPRAPALPGPRLRWLRAEGQARGLGTLVLVGGIWDGRYLGFIPCVGRRMCTEFYFCYDLEGDLERVFLKLWRTAAGCADRGGLVPAVLREPQAGSGTATPSPLGPLAATFS